MDDDFTTVGDLNPVAPQSFPEPPSHAIPGDSVPYRAGNREADPRGLPTSGLSKENPEVGARQLPSFTVNALEFDFVPKPPGPREAFGRGLITSPS